MSDKLFITCTYSEDNVEQALYQYDQRGYDLIGSTMVKPEKYYTEISRHSKATILLMFKRRIRP